MRALSILNVRLMPTYSGTHCGCMEAEISLSKITTKIVKSRVAADRREDSDISYKTPFTGFNDMYY